MFDRNLFKKWIAELRTRTEGPHISNVMSATINIDGKPIRCFCATGLLPLLDGWREKRINVPRHVSVFLNSTPNQDLWNADVTSLDVYVFNNPDFEDDYYAETSPGFSVYDKVTEVVLEEVIFLNDNHVPWFQIADLLEAYEDRLYGPDAWSHIPFFRKSAITLRQNYDEENRIHFVEVPS